MYLILYYKSRSKDYKQRTPIPKPLYIQQGDLFNCVRSYIKCFTKNYMLYTLCFTCMSACSICAHLYDTTKYRDFVNKL